MGVSTKTPLNYIHSIAADTGSCPNPATFDEKNKTLYYRFSYIHPAGI